MSPAKIRQLMAIFRTKNVDTDAQQVMIHTYTDGRTSSKTEMTDTEAEQLIRDLNGHNPAVPRSLVPLDGDRQRKKIIGIFRSMGWEKDGKADMERIQAWIVKYGKYNPKKLNEYTVRELPLLVSQVQMLHRGWIEYQNKPAK